MPDVKVHKCPNPGPFPVENRGDGWYIYDGDSRGEKPCRFCYRCGAKLECDVKEAGDASN